MPILNRTRTCCAVATFAAVVGLLAQAPLRSQTPNFYRDVAPILQQHCQSCHRDGEIAPMPLVTYRQTRPWADKIATMVSQKRMPPWFADPHFGKFSNDPSLTPEQIQTLVAWAKSGTPMGDPREATPAAPWTRGWNIAQPDLVLAMPKPVPIPAQGDVDYTYEIVHTGFTEDKWVRMCEIRPSSPRY